MRFDKNNPRYLEQLLAADVAHSRENHGFVFGLSILSHARSA
jgi:hypothetical protein